MCEACIFLKRVKRDGKGARRAMDVSGIFGVPCSNEREEGWDVAC